MFDDLDFEAEGFNFQHILTATLLNLVYYNRHETSLIIFDWYQCFMLNGVFKLKY